MDEMGNTGKGKESGDKEIGKQEISFGYVECVMSVSCPSGNNEKAVRDESGVQGTRRRWS